jgi:hypothetical protein
LIPAVSENRILTEAQAGQYAGENRFVTCWTEDAAVKVPRHRGTASINRGSGAGGLAVEMAKNEYESFQVILTPKGSTQTGYREVQVTRPHLEGEGVTHELSVEIKQIGFINDVHPDALFPVDSWFDIPPGENLHFWVTVYTPKATRAGIYRGGLRILFQRGDPIDVPFEVKVWDFMVSEVTHLQNYLGGHVNTDDIVNRYGLPYWSPEFERFMAEEVFEKLARYRMMPVEPTPIRWDRWGEAPLWVTGRHGKALRFDGEYMYYEVPFSSSWGVSENRFDLSSGFTLSAWIKLERLGRKQTILSHGPAWGGGYELAVTENDRIGFYLGSGYEQREKEKNQSRLHSVVSNRRLDEEWHHVAATFDLGSVQIAIDGRLDQEVELPINRLTSSYRPLFIAANPIGTREPFTGLIDEVRIYDRPLTTEEIRRDGESPQPLYAPIEDLSFETYPSYVPAHRSVLDPEGVRYFRKWAAYWVDRGFGFTLPKWQKIDDLPRFWALFYPMLEGENWFDRSSIKLPHDEVVTGATAGYHIEWGRRTRQLAPRVRIHHTTGGKRITPDRSSDFTSYVGLVDIWIPNIYKHYLRHPPTRAFFDREMEKGNQVNFYFKWTRLERPYLDTRYAFWLMMRYGFGPSLYRSAFWTRPLKRRRPEKSTWEVEKGFTSSRSSGSGVGYGIYFWPGKNGLVPSVRAEMYRDGVEDYEYHYSLRQLADRLERSDRAATYRVLLADTRQVLDIPKGIWNGVDSQMIPVTEDPGILAAHRRLMAEQIEKVEKVLEPTGGME